MPAMVRPIGIDHTKLRHRRVPVLGIPKIFLAKGQILQGHGEAHRPVIVFQFLAVPAYKALYPSHIRRNLRLHVKAFRLIQGSDSGFHRVHQIGLDFLKLLVGNIPLDSHHPGGQHLRALPLGQQLDALSGGIGPLVVLAGQIFHSEHPVALRRRKFLIIYLVHIRLRKDRPSCLLELLLRKPRNIVTIQITQVLNRGHPKIFSQIRHNMARFDIKARFLFHKDSDYPRHLFLHSAAQRQLTARSASILTYPPA